MKYDELGMMAGEAETLFSGTKRAEDMFVKSAPVKFAPVTSQSIITLFLRYAFCNLAYGPTKYAALL